MNKLEQLKKKLNEAEIANDEADRASYIAYKAFEAAKKAYNNELHRNTIKETLEYNYKKFWIKKTKKQIEKEINRLSKKASSCFQNKDYTPTIEMSNNDEILNLKEILELKSNIIIDKDGSSYHARFKDFKNLQESISGFGNSPKKAEKELYNNF